MLSTRVGGVGGMRNSSKNMGEVGEAKRQIFIVSMSLGTSLWTEVLALRSLQQMEQDIS